MMQPSKRHAAFYWTGFSGIMAGAGTIFFSYICFSAGSTAPPVAQNPPKKIPIGVL